MVPSQRAPAALLSRTGPGDAGRARSWVVLGPVPPEQGPAMVRHHRTRRWAALGRDAVRAFAWARLLG